MLWISEDDNSREEILAYMDKLEGIMNALKNDRVKISWLIRHKKRFGFEVKKTTELKEKLLNKLEKDINYIKSEYMEV